MPKRETFRGASSIVTGAASGIGRALASELLARGARVVLADIDGEEVENAARDLRARGHDAHATRLDVTDAPVFEALVDRVSREAGRLDLLVNNAGIAIGGEARDLSLEDWRRVIDVNLGGTLHGVVAAYPRMVRQGFGHIVNVASVAGFVPYPLVAPYTTSKHAVYGLTRALRAEGAALGVKVSVVCPGAIRTPIWTRTAIRGVVNAPARAAIQTHARSSMSPERCARIILRGVEANRGTILVTGEAHLLWSLQRISPSILDHAYRGLLAWTRRGSQTSNDEAPTRA